MSRRAWLAFAAMATIWGIPYLFIKVAIDDGVPPMLVAFGRSAVGAAVLLPLALRGGALSLLRGRWRWVIAYALAEITIPFALIPLGEQHVASSLAAILIATTPLIVALIALFSPSEGPMRMRLIGLATGFAGVVVFMGVDVAGRPDELLGALSILGAAAGYAIGAAILRLRLPQSDPIALNAVALGFATVALAPLAAADPPTRMPSWQAIGAITLLGLICSAAGFVIFTVLVGYAGSSRAVVVTYVSPVIAVGVGVALLGETPGRGALVGLVLILAGAWLATRDRSPAKPGAVARSTAGPAPSPASPEHRLRDSSQAKQPGATRPTG